MIQCITYRVSHEVSSKTIWSPASFFLAGVSFNMNFMNHVKPEQILTTGTSFKKTADRIDQSGSRGVTIRTTILPPKSSNHLATKASQMAKVHLKRRCFSIVGIHHRIAASGDGHLAEYHQGISRM